MAGYKWPKNPDIITSYRSRFSVAAHTAINWLRYEFGFGSLVQVRLEEDHRIHVGFTRKLELQMNNLLRFEERENNAHAKKEFIEGMTSPKAIDMAHGNSKQIEYKKKA